MTTPGGEQPEQPVQGVPVEQLIEDAQKLMKAFMEQKGGSPTLRTLRVESSGSEREMEDSPQLRELLKNNEELTKLCKMGLLDSGATHPLRPRVSNDSVDGVGSVNVTLAGENRVKMDQTKTGAILGGKDAQPIVPLGTLVKSLGYEFAWDRRGCRLKHPTKKEIKVYTRSTCPEIMQCDALRLIAELEQAKIDETMESLAQLKASVSAVRDYKERSWKDMVRDYVASGTVEDATRAVLAAPFMHHAPMNGQLKILPKSPDNADQAWVWMKQFPLNRANRRQLWQSREWIVHMFSGKSVRNDPLRDFPGLLEVDLQKGWNLNDEKIYGVLVWAAREGRIKHVFGGPPAGTFSPMRYQRDNHAELRPLRSVHEPWGLREGLTVEESSKVYNENMMMYKMLWLWLCAEVANEDRDVPGHQVGFCMEYPEDPKEYLPEGNQKDTCVSVWRTELVQKFASLMELGKVQFEQGALGHMMRRPTCCLTNMGLGIHGLRDSRAFISSESAEGDQTVWPHGFRITLADAIHEWDRSGGPALRKAMTKRELEEWKAHVERGHWPYRRDCSVCLAASGTGRPARRVVHRDAYVMSLDIAGPFAEKGKDEVRGGKYKFVLAATYLFPKIREVPEDAPIPDEDEAEKFLEEFDDEPGEPEGEDDPELQAQEEEWKKKIADLRKPMELQALRFCIPLERHTGKEILECIQDLYVKLRALGLPLTRIHSDRAREFRVKPVRKWCRERDIYQTFTEGLAPTQNAAAESHVKWLKSQARTHLGAAELDKELWPCAMKHACQLHNARQLGHKSPEIKFGSVVWVKSKKDRGPFDPKWERGKYMGPADDVREGHVVRLDDGLWLRTLHMRTVRDDEVEDEDEAEHVIDLVEPTRRIRRKTKLPDPEIHSLRTDARRALVNRLLKSKIWEHEEARVERPQMKEGQVWEGAAYVNLGAYQHGGITSLTKATEKFMEEAEIAAQLIALDHPGRPFTSIALVKNATMPAHKDAFNLKGTMNLVSPAKVTSRSSVWQEMKPGDEFHGNYHAMWVNGREVPGQKFNIEKPTMVRPDRLHAPLKGDPGDRIVAIGYNVSKWEKLLDHQCEDLQELGFQLPTRQPVIKMMNDNNRRPRPPTPPIPDSLQASTTTPPSGTTAVLGTSGVVPDSSNESTLQRPTSEDRMQVSSATPGPYSNQTSSSGSTNRPREHFPEIGGERLDSMVVPGGRVELRLRWAIRFCPDPGEQEEAIMTSMPLLPLGHEEEQRMRSRVTWLSEFVEEERQIRIRQAARGEYPTQRERQLFYKLDDAIDYMNEVLALSHQAREDGNVNLMRLAANPETTQEVEQMLQKLTEPIETVHNVELQEVKNHLSEWKESIRKEVEGLMSSGTLRPVPLADARKMAQAGEIVLVPAKTVHTIKPPNQGQEGLYKRKSRLVICGNYVNSDVEVYTASANAESVRVSLSYAAHKRWHGAITDVNSAFTLTPMEESKVKYAITVPKVVVDAGHAPPDIAYMVDRVLYGLREAPRLWGSFRDRRVGRARLKVDNQDCMFLQMETDQAVWRLVTCEDPTSTKAITIIYVDDVLMLGPEGVVGDIYKWLTEGNEGEEGWKCSPMEWLGREPVRYLGMDVRRRAVGDVTSFHISQGSYVMELLKSYPEESKRPSMVPATKEVMPSIDDDEEEPVLMAIDPEMVKQAQRMAGELLWLVTRWVMEVEEGDGVEPVVLRVDNTAACGLATTAPGSWKTRHLKVKARHIRLETAEGRIKVEHTPGDVQVADMGTKPVPASRLEELRRLWGMCSAEDFEDEDRKVILRSLAGPDYYYDLMRMFAWLMMVAGTPKASGAELYNKKPIEYDGSVEFYVIIAMAGIALLGIWELLKWIAMRCFGEDETTLAKARRLMKIRNQASRALQEELASMSSSSADPMYNELEGKPKPKVATPTPAAEVDPPKFPMTPMPMTTTRSTMRVDDDPDLRAALTSARNGDFIRHRGGFIMSEYGDKLHFAEGCHGLRHANKSKLKRVQVCHYCDVKFPHFYKVTNENVLPEG
ncbi:GIP [Symbiodinium sp. CCMP2456]|nr:GIP [Symbiodinium sp. CCMP2456]